jgi:hypothetical protein
MAAGEGTLIFDFGSGAGANIATTTGISAAGVTSASRIEIYLDGTSSTETHNAYEHSILELGGFSMMPISKGTDTFSAQAATLLRLTGTISARFVWST